MDKPEFYQKLAEILDVEEVKPEDVLKSFDVWDSLAILSVLAMADAKYGVSIKSGASWVSASNPVEVVAEVT